MLRRHGVAVGPGDLLPPEAAGAGQRQAAVAPDHHQLAGGEVGGQVALFREQAHPAFGLERDAAGGDGGDAAVLEPDAGVGDVLVRAGHGGAQGVHAADRAIDQGQDQVEVVDHQVQDDRHVGTARLERGDAGAFDIQGPGDAGADGTVFGAVAQEVADLQDGAGLLGQGCQLVGLRQRGGDRLLDQDVAAGLDGLGGQRVMGVGGGGDDQRVTGGQQVRKRQGRRPHLPRDDRGTGGVRVVQPGQHGTAACGNLQGMEAPEMPGPSNADP